MCLIRSDDEMAAAEALLLLAGFWGRVQRNVETTTKVPIASANVAKSTSVIITSTPQLGKGHHHISFDENYSRESVILSVDRNGQVNENKNAPSSPEKLVYTPKVLKIRSPIQIFPSKLKSGRVVKRTKRFISESDEVDQLSNPVKKTTPVKKLNQKSVEEKKSIEEKKKIEQKKKNEEKKPSAQKNNSKSADEIHPAKKMKLSVAEERKITVSNSEVLKGRFNEIFSNVETLIQSECMRHSRLSESVYELQHCKKFDAIVDFQYRAAENLKQYQVIVEEKRNEALSNRSAQMNKWMKKFRTIKNREETCDDFIAQFKTTTSNQWKPFAEDASRSSDVLNYKFLQIMRKPLIKVLVDEYVQNNLTKEKARSNLIEILKLLPNRPEVRYEFMNVYLPKVVAMKKSINRKGNRYSLKKETEVNPAFQAYF